MIENSVLKSTRCLYHSAIYDFLQTKNTEILGELISSYHGSSLTTTNVGGRNSYTEKCFRNMEG